MKKNLWFSCLLLIMVSCGAEQHTEVDIVKTKIYALDVQASALLDLYRRNVLHDPTYDFVQFIRGTYKGTSGTWGEAMDEWDATHFRNPSTLLSAYVKSIFRAYSETKSFERLKRCQVLKYDADGDGRIGDAWEMDSWLSSKTCRIFGLFTRTQPRVEYGATLTDEAIYNETMIRLLVKIKIGVGKVNGGKANFLMAIEKEVF